MTGEGKGKNSGEKRTFEKTRVFSKSKCGQKKVIFKKKKERKEMVREKKKESRSLITKDGIVGCLTLGQLMLLRSNMVMQLETLSAHLKEVQEQAKLYNSDKSHRRGYSYEGAQGIQGWLDTVYFLGNQRLIICILCACVCV